MIPDNSRKKLEQMRQEMALRAQLSQQYDKEMAARYTRDMPSFTEWMAKRQQQPMAKGGKVLSHEQREANKAKFLSESVDKDIFYHGGRGNVKALRPSPHRVKEGLPDAVFVSPEPAVANEFSIRKSTDNDFSRDTDFSQLANVKSGANVMPLHVQVKNPFDVEKPEHHKALKDYLLKHPPEPAYKVVDQDSLKAHRDQALKEALTHADHAHTMGVNGYDNYFWLERPHIQKAIKNLGHDSFYTYEMNAKNLGIYDPRKIKSSIGNRGTYDTNEHDITKAKGGSVEPTQDAMRLALTKRHGMYSPLEKAAIEIPRNKGTGAEFMAEVSKRPGFKAEEIADRRIPIPEGKMTKAEFLEHLKKHSNPPLREDIRHSMDDDQREERLRELIEHHGYESYAEVPRAAMKKFSDQIDSEAAQYDNPDYNLPDGKNYREILLSLPERKPNPKNYKDPAAYDAAMKAFNENGSEDYTSGHWKDDPNVLMHMRLSDRRGPNNEKLLHLEELQSDWHQQGRTLGYARPRAEVLKEMREENERQLEQHEASIKEKKKAFFDEIKSIKEQLRSMPIGASDVGAQLRARELEIMKQFRALDEMPEPEPIKVRDNGVPQAPFKKSWHELGMKHVLHHAAKHGYHGVVITPGTEQARRWRNEGLKVHYDQRIPSFLNKFGNQFGAQVGQHVIDKGGYKVNRDSHEMPFRVESETSPDIISRHPTAEAAWSEAEKLGSLPLHHFPITEPMREKILKEGLPQYMSGGVIYKAEGGKVQPSIAQMRMALKNRTPIEVQSIGINEAPNMSPKVYIPPEKEDSIFPAPGGVATSDGMPIGGIDMSKMQAGQQLMPLPPQAPPQPPQGAQPPQGGQPPQPPQGMPPMGQPPMGVPQGGNILQMTPQGQMMAAIGGGQPKPINMKRGGHVYADGGGVTVAGATGSGGFDLHIPINVGGSGGSGGGSGGGVSSLGGMINQGGAGQSNASFAPSSSPAPQGRANPAIPYGMFSNRPAQFGMPQQNLSNGMGTPAPTSLGAMNASPSVPQPQQPQLDLQTGYTPWDPSMNYQKPSHNSLDTGFNGGMYDAAGNAEFTRGIEGNQPFSQQSRTYMTMTEMRNNPKYQQDLMYGIDPNTGGDLISSNYDQNGNYIANKSGNSTIPAGGFYASGGNVKKPTVEQMKQAIFQKAQEGLMKPSEALGRHEGKYLHITEADRAKVEKRKHGMRGGVGFSQIGLEDPEYAGRVWGVGKSGTAIKLLNREKRGLSPEDKAIWSTFIGTPEMHTSNQLVFNRMWNKFQEARKQGLLSPEQEAQMLDMIRSAMTKGTEKNPSKAVFDPDVSFDNTHHLFDTFERRRILSDLMAGKKIGGKKAQIFDASKMIEETTDPRLLHAPSMSVGPHLFSFSGETSHEPHLNKAFPFMLHGEAHPEAFQQIPFESAAPDFVQEIQQSKGRAPGYMDIVRRIPRQFISEKYLTGLQKQGRKKGGKVKLTPNQDTMRLELTRKK